MIEKIKCKNGNILIFTENNQITKSDSNDINVIDISKIKNDIEELDNQKELIIRTNEYNKKVRKKNKFYAIVLPLIFLSLLVNPIFNTLTNELFVMRMFKYLMLGTVSLLTFTEFFGILPRYKKEIENNNKVLIFIEKHKKKLEKKIEKLQQTRSYSVIREGQEFMLKENKGIVNALVLLKSYYNHQQLVNAQFSDSTNLKDDIKQKFAEAFIICKIDGYNQDIVINEVYDNILEDKDKRKVRMKIKR